MHKKKTNFKEICSPIIFPGFFSKKVLQILMNIFVWSTDGASPWLKQTKKEKLINITKYKSHANQHQNCYKTFLKKICVTRIFYKNTKTSLGILACVITHACLHTPETELGMLFKILKLIPHVQKIVDILYHAPGHHKNNFGRVIYHTPSPFFINKTKNPKQAGHYFSISLNNKPIEGSHSF